MKKLKNNKKAAFFAEIFTDFFSYIILTLIFIIFIVIFHSCSHLEQNIGSKSSNLESNMILLNYLRTPIEKDITVADLVIESYINNDYSDLEKTTKKHFNPKYSKKWQSWVLSIKPEKTDKFEIKGDGFDNNYVLSQSAQLIIPSPGQENIEITLSIQSQSAENIIMEGGGP